MPTSMTAAPGLIQSPARTPAGRRRPTRMSARRRSAGKVAGARMGDGDGAVFGQQQLRDRLADQLERPITTASSPASAASIVLASSMQPSGVQGDERRRPLPRRRH